MVSHRGCLRVDFVAEDAGLVDAEFGAGAVSELGAGGQESVVAYRLKDGELGAGNVGGEEFGAGVEGDSGVYGAGNDLRGNGDFGERVRIEGWADGRRHGEDGADARIAMRFGAFAERGLDRWIGFGESGGFGEKSRVLDGVDAHAIGFGRFAKVLIAGKIGDAAGDFDYREAAEREPGSADALGVDTRAECGISVQLVEDGA